MQRSTLMISLLGSWALAIIYDKVRINTGVEIKLLLWTAILTMIVGLYLYCRNPKETYEREVE